MATPSTPGRRAPRAKRPAAPLPSDARRPRQSAPTDGTDAAALDRYAQRGLECAFANVRLLGRVVAAYYDEMLRPADLRASQLALMWAVLALEPVEQKSLERVTETDQTTLSRTVENLRAAGLVSVTPGRDRRVRVVRLSAQGRRTFLRAMPHWEAAQRQVEAWLALPDLRNMAREARRFARHRVPGEP